MDFKVGDLVRFKLDTFGPSEGMIINVYPSKSFPYLVQSGVWTHSFRADELELIHQEQPEPPTAIQETEPEKTKEEIEKDNLRKFFFGESPELPGLAKQWKTEGKCPNCGEEGRVHLSTFICSKHGAY